VPFPKELTEWVVRNADKPGFQMLLARLSEQVDALRLQAMQPGNTDFSKGQVAGLQWACNLPVRILKASIPADDTSETSAEKT